MIGLAVPCLDLWDTEAYTCPVHTCNLRCHSRAGV